MWEMQGLIPGLGRSPGEGNGYWLQYSCLGNPMDRGAWPAGVHGAPKSQTWLSGWACTWEICCLTVLEVGSLKSRCQWGLVFLRVMRLNQFFAFFPEPTHWKRLWCWERLKAGREGDDRGQDGWMASPTQWARVWASSGRWWSAGKPAVLQSMGSLRVGHD